VIGLSRGRVASTRAAICLRMAFRLGGRDQVRTPLIDFSNPTLRPGASAAAAPARSLAGNQNGLSQARPVLERLEHKIGHVCTCNPILEADVLSALHDPYFAFRLHGVESSGVDDGPLKARGPEHVFSRRLVLVDTLSHSPNELHDPIPLVVRREQEGGQHHDR
jgi:hypothetical protein